MTDVLWTRGFNHDSLCLCVHYRVKTCYSCSYGAVRRVNVYLFLLGDVRDGDAGGRIFVYRRRGQTESAGVLLRIKDPSSVRIRRIPPTDRTDRISAERETFVRRRPAGAKRMQIITRYGATETRRRHRSLYAVARRPADRSQLQDPPHPSVSCARRARLVVVVFGS